MVPLEWPIAARFADPAALATRRGDRDRLSAVRIDFFLDEQQRLTEQERALMTAMLADLVSVIADEIRAAARLRSESANDDGGRLFEALKASGLLDIPALVALLLRRAEQERIAQAVRGGGKSTRFLHALAGDRDASVSAAAMALILGRSRRRDRFDAPRIDLDDVPAEAAVQLVSAVAAALRKQQPASAVEVERAIGEGASALLAAHDEGRRLEALTFAFVHALDAAGRLDEDMLRQALAEGEVSILVEALARRAGLQFDTAWDRVLAGGARLAMLLRMADVSRSLAAEIAASLTFVLPGDAGEVLERFDSSADDAVELARRWWRLDPAYRSAIAALGGTDGDPGD